MVVAEDDAVEGIRQEIRDFRKDDSGGGSGRMDVDSAVSELP